MTYYVEATSNNDEFADEIEASDLFELAQLVRETFAYMNGCYDTSEVDCSWIDFTYNKVEDEDCYDVTAEANDAK